MVKKFENKKVKNQKKNQRKFWFEQTKSEFFDKSHSRTHKTHIEKWVANVTYYDDDPRPHYYIRQSPPPELYRMVTKRQYAKAMGRTAKRLVKQAKWVVSKSSQAAAANAVGNIVKSGVKRAYNYARTTTSTKRAKKNKYSITGVSTGVYRGKFKKPVRTRSSFRNVCAKKGYTFVREYYRSETAQHALYVKHAAYDLDRMVHAIFGAALRKLFLKAGIEIVSNLLAPKMSNDGGGTALADFRLRCQYYSPHDGGIGWDQYDIPAASTFDQIITNATIISNRIGNYLKGTTGNFPTVYQLQCLDTGSVPTRYNTLAALNLESTKWKMEVISKLKIQNRSKGAEAGVEDSSLDRVDNVPLYGKLFSFKNCDPRLKTIDSAGTAASNSEWFGRMAANGIGFYDPDTHYPSLQEPPTKGMFNNCAAESNVILQPGNIKTASVSYVYAGKWQTFLDRMAGEFGNDTVPVTQSVVTGIIGRSQILALEEILRTGTSNPVAVQIERQVEINVMFTKTANNYLIGKLDTATTF